MMKQVMKRVMVVTTVTHNGEGGDDYDIGN